MLIAEESYETAEPTIDSHIVKLKSTGADVFINISTPKFAAQAIKKIAEIDWKVMHIVSNVSASVGSVIKPAGFENAQGIPRPPMPRTAPTRSGQRSRDEEAVCVPREVLSRSQPARRRSGLWLRRGADTGEGAGNVRRRPNPRQRHEAGSEPEGFCTRHPAAGVKINTSATDFAPIEQLRMMRFKGEKWDLFGDIISGELGH